MVRKRDLSPRLGMAPNFMAAGTGTVELETKRSQMAGNFPVGKSCEAPHLRDRNRNAEFALRPNLAPEHRGEWIAVFPAGFHNFSGEALSDFDRFSNTAAFGHQSRNIRAGTQIAAILQIRDANSNGHFLDFCEVLLSFHWEGSFAGHYSKDTQTGRLYDMSCPFRIETVLGCDKRLNATSSANPNRSPRPRIPRTGYSVPAGYLPSQKLSAPIKRLPSK
jgi:hypothetical protein